MPASKEYWEKNPGQHAALMLIWSATAFGIVVATFINGGFGKWDSPTVTPQNSPVLFWLGIGGLLIAGLFVLACGIRALKALPEKHKELKTHYHDFLK